MLKRTLWYSQTGQNLNLRKKVASQYGVSNAFLPEITTFKERYPKLECKSSVNPLYPFFGNLTLLVQKKGVGRNYENTLEII